ncbi:hypothetical protein lerEdw1_006506 [Lerista edwardsae]|nr:hypothetical protein lerEdw1_006506 [Lerista edwardsae]
MGQVQGKNPLLAVLLLLAVTHCASRRSSPASSLACHPEKVLKTALSAFDQRVCTYNEVRYETVLLRGCPLGVDPSFTYPVAISCHCDFCKTDSSDCTVQSVGPNICSNQRISAK